jgi:hypothetical protein
MNKRDKLLQSIDASDTMTVNGLNYGDDLPEELDYNILENKVKAVFRVNAVFVAGNITFRVFAGATASPTVCVAQSPEIDRTTLAVNDLIDVPIPSGVLDKYVRLGVFNSIISATGSLEGELQPVFG